MNSYFKKIRTILIIVVAMLGLAFSAAAFIHIRSIMRDEFKSNFGAYADKIAIFLRKEIDEKILTVEMVGGFFNGSTFVEREEFKEFVAPIIKRVSALASLEWAPRVTASKRAECELNSRADGFEEFEIKDLNVSKALVRAGERAEYFPVFYAEPPDLMEPIMGFDLLSETNRAGVLSQARVSGETVVSGKIDFLKDKKERSGFMIYCPVYQKGTSKKSSLDRFNNIEGFAIGVFDVKALVDNAVGLVAPSKVMVDIFDVDRKSKNMPVYICSYNGVKGEGSCEARTIQFANRKWIIKVYPVPDIFIVYQIFYPWTILGAGLIITFLLIFYLFHSDKVRALLENENREREQALKELKNSSDKLTALMDEQNLVLDNIKDFLYKQDAEGRFLYISRSVEHVTGYSQSVWKEHNKEFVTDNIMNRMAMDFLKITLSTGQEQYPYHREIYHKDGYKVILEISEKPFFEKGKIAGIIGVARDITRRYMAEGEVNKLKRQMEFILGATKTGLDIIDANLNIIYVDPAWARIYGDYRGKKCYEYFMGRKSACPSCGVKKALDTKAVVVTEEILIKENNRPVQVTTIPYQNERGEWLVAEVNVDLTERKKTEEIIKQTNIELRARETALKNMLYDLNATYDALKSSNKKLIQTEKLASIGQLAAGIAHEINNPLSFVNSNLATFGKYIDMIGEMIKLYDSLTVLVDDSAEPKALKLKNDIRAMEKDLDIKYILRDLGALLSESKEGIDRIKKIVMDLRIFSRKDEEARVSSDINSIIESILNIIWNEIKYKAEIKKEYGVIPMFECNPQQIGQVLLNLIVNAAQAIFDKGLIGIKTYAEKDNIYVEISDTGKGMTQDVLDKIFEPFFTTKDPGKGTGLGLSISYDIIKKHKGDIYVNSEPGRGTKFTIVLPVIKN